MAKRRDTVVKGLGPTRISVGDLRDVIVGGFKFAFAMAVAPVEPLTSSTLALTGLADLWKGLKVQKGLGGEAFRVFVEAYLMAMGAALAKHGGYEGNRSEEVESLGRKVLSETAGEYDLLDLLHQDLGDFALVVELQQQARLLLLKLGLKPHVVTLLGQDVRKSYELTFGHCLWRLRRSAPIFHAWYHEVFLPSRRPATALALLEGHQESLRMELSRPLSMARGHSFSAAFTLGNLYVEPSLVMEEAGRLKQTPALEAILAALDRPRPIIVHGQPGQGKTSLVKILAARLLDERPDLTCVYVPFAQIPSQAPLLSFLRERVGPWLGTDFLESNRVLLLADGLDEAQVVAGRSSFLDVFQAIQSLVDRVNGSSKTLFTAVYTGRSTFVQTYRQVFPEDSLFLRIADFDERQQVEWCGSFRRVTRKAPSLGRLRRMGFDDFLGQPVLLTLLALMDLENGLTESSGERSRHLDRSALYERIVLWTYQRRWSEGAVNSLAYFVDSSDHYFELLEQIALAIFRHGGRSLDEASLTAELEREPEVGRAMGSLSLRDFLRRVKISFHFEAREGSAYEFIHKSIEDYLVARKIGREAGDLLRFADRFDKYAEPVILPALHRVSCNRSIDREHALFLRQILRRLPPADLLALRMLFQRLWRRTSTDVFIGAEEALLPGVLRLDGAINVCLTILHILVESHHALTEAGVIPSTDLLDLLDGDPARLGRVVDLCDASRPGRFAAAGLSFRGCDLSGAVLSGKSLAGVDFAYARLNGAKLERSKLVNADFRAAGLVSADLRWCDLAGANFSEAETDGLLIAGSKVEGIQVDWRHPPRKLRVDWRDKSREKVDRTVPRLLVIDQEEVVLDVVSAIFRKDGFHVDCAPSGEEGLARMREYSYDVLLVELMLPGISGQEVLAEVRAAEPDLPVIIVTAYSSIESAKMALLAGAVDYIAKPFKTEELRQAVTQVLAAGVKFTE